jgi:hypothetical protein
MFELIFKALRASSPVEVGAANRMERDDQPETREPRPLSGCPGVIWSPRTGSDLQRTSAGTASCLGFPSPLST